MSRISLNKEKSGNDFNKRSVDVSTCQNQTFDQFFIHPKILEALFEFGFFFPSPIQYEAIPIILEGKNLVARAKSGTGKTAAYSIPILHMIDLEIPQIQALVLVPTRELAKQTTDLLISLGKELNIRVNYVSGGYTFQEDILSIIDCPQILFGTPGRVLDLAGKGVISLKHVKTLVMDEADQLLFQDMFLISSRLASYFQNSIQYLIFSTTFSHSSEEFIKNYIKNPVMLSTMKEIALIEMTHYYLNMREDDKLNKLLQILAKLRVNQTIIFCNSNKRVECLSKLLLNRKIENVHIHSHISQGDRDLAFDKFKEGKSRILICSDLINRGIDIANVNVVINYDISSDSMTYVHRVGRGGRFGRKSLAINFIREKDIESFSKIQKELGIKIQHFPEEINHYLYS